MKKMGEKWSKKKKKAVVGGVTLTVGLLLILYWLWPALQPVLLMQPQKLPDSIGTLQSTYPSRAAGISVSGNTIIVPIAGTTYPAVAISTNGGTTYETRQIETTNWSFASAMDVAYINDNLYVTLVNEHQGALTVDVFKSSNPAGAWQSQHIADVSGQATDFVKQFKMAYSVSVFIGGVDSNANSDYRLWSWDVNGGPYYHMRVNQFDPIDGKNILTGTVIGLTMDSYSNFHALLRVWTGITEDDYYLMYAKSTDGGTTWNTAVIPKSTLSGISISSIGLTPFFADGSNVVFTVTQAHKNELNYNGKIYLVQTSNGGANWYSYSYTTSDSDWLNTPPPLALYQGNACAFWLRDVDGKPAIVRWDGQGEPTIVQQYDTIVVKSLESLQATVSGDTVYILAGEGRGTSLSGTTTYSDLRVLAYPQEATTSPGQIELPKMDYIFYAGVVLAVIGGAILWSAKGKKQ